MIICSFDWGAIGSIAGAIATFIGAGVALFISWQWKKQKRLESLSSLSKDAIVLLSDSLFVNTQISMYIEDVSNGRSVENVKIEKLKEEYAKKNDLAIGCYINILTGFTKDMSENEIKELSDLSDMYFNIKSFIETYNENYTNNYISEYQGFDIQIHHCISILIKYYHYDKSV